MIKKKFQYFIFSRDVLPLITCLFITIIIGCQSPPPLLYDMSSAGYEMMSRDPTYNPKQRQSFAAMSAIMANEGRRTHERNLAEQNQTEINVSLNQSNKPYHHSLNIKQRPKYANKYEAQGRVILTPNLSYYNRRYVPSQGYEWVEPEDDNDLRVQLFKENKEE